MLGRMTLNADPPAFGVSYHDGSVCLSHDSPVWGLPAEQFAEFLNRRRVAAAHSADAELLSWALGNHAGQPVPLHEAVRRPFRGALERAPCNPFLTEEEAAMAAAFLTSVYDWVDERLRNRDARLRAPPRPAPKLWGAKRAAVERDGGRCRYCGAVVGHAFHIDHVIPRAYGGPTTVGNLVVACVGCNLRKGGRTPPEAGMVLLQPPQCPTMA